MNNTETMLSVPRDCFFFFVLIFFFFHAVPVPTLSQWFPPLVAPVQKDHTKLQYTISVYYIKDPSQRTTLLLHLGGRFSWVDCYTNYTSTTYTHIPCNFTVCVPLDSLACLNCYDRPAGTTCSNDTCAYFPENPLTRSVGLENGLLNSLGLEAINPDGSLSGRVWYMRDFIFSCAKPHLLKGFAKGISGLAALGFSKVSLPVQLSGALSLPSCFALCLPASRSSHGVAFFGTRGPYRFGPDIDLSESLVYTPLLVNPYGDTVITYALAPSAEYFFGVTSVKVNGKRVPLNSTLLKIDDNSGSGGTMLSTVAPYSVLHSSIYRAVTEAFARESSAMNFTSVTAVKPFSLCYRASDVASADVGPAVPAIDLVLQRKDVVWRIIGANSMVRVKRKNVDMWCLAVVDGGAKARAAVVIGGHQMEDNLLQFDFGSMRLGFSSSVLMKGTTCASFRHK